MLAAKDSLRSGEFDAFNDCVFDRYFLSSVAKYSKLFALCKQGISRSFVNFLQALSQIEPGNLMRFED